MIPALTIEANEVSLAGTQQDGIQASSVSITNLTGGNCKSVSVTATSSSDSWAAIRALGSADTANITVKADDLFICGNGSAKAINAAGTVTIEGAGLIVGAIAAGMDNIDRHIICAANGGDKSDGLNLSTPPAESTYYTAGSGYCIFTPADGGTPASLTLHSASITTASASPLELGAETVIQLEGTNSLTNSKTGSGTGITAYNSGVQPDRQRRRLQQYQTLALADSAARPAIE